MSQFGHNRKGVAILLAAAAVLLGCGREANVRGQEGVPHLTPGRDPGAATAQGAQAGQPEIPGQLHLPRPLQVSPTTAPVPFTAPPPAARHRPLPINLATALALVQASPLDIALATERIRAAAADLQRARAAWLPTVTFGSDYFRHDGQIQDVAGNVISTSKSSLMLGAGSGIGANAILSLTDALFAPLALRQVLRARDADLQAARNDTLQAMAEAYFNVQQARGDLAGTLDVVGRSEELVRRLAGLAPAVATSLDATRARAELARDRQLVRSAYERWRVAAAELARILRLDAAAVVEPLEAPDLRVTLVDPEAPVDELIPLGLRNRPELASQRALVEATLVRLRTERLRPLIPSVLVRGASTPVTGTLGVGYFGGGINSSLKNFSGRMDVDVQVLWELQNLGFGNRAAVRQQESQNRLALLDLFRIQDRVAAEVARAHAQLQSAAGRGRDAEQELKEAADSARLNFQGLYQSRAAGGGGAAALLVRPQEAVASVQALAQAYFDYYAAAADYNRAQFRLYRALGHPAQALTGK